MRELLAMGLNLPLLVDQMADLVPYRAKLGEHHQQRQYRAAECVTDQAIK